MVSSRASSSVSSQGKPRPNRRRRPTPEPEPVAAPRPAARVRFALLRARVAAGFARLRKPLLLIWRVALVSAVTASAVASGRLIERYARSAAAFATREIAVEGLQRLTRDEVLVAAGLTLGKNVFEVSPEQARDALQKHPWIAEATVTRRLPGSYRIELREQQVAALLALDGLYLVGEDGSVFKPLTAADPVDLPVITGVDPERFRADLGFRTALLTSAVALLHDYRDAGLFRREPISEIHAEPDGSVSVYVGQDSVQVRLGVGPFRKKLRNLRNIFDELRDDAARPAYVYLDNERRPDRVAVRLR